HRFHCKQPFFTRIRIFFTMLKSWIGSPSRTRKSASRLSSKLPILRFGKIIFGVVSDHIMNYEASSSWAIADITVLEDIGLPIAPGGASLVCKKMWLARDPGFVTAIIVM